MRIPITVTESVGQSRRGAPVELGLPLPEGAVAPETRWVVLDEQERALPGQFKPLAQYEDGSLRAAHGVFLLDMQPGQTRHLTVAAGELPVGELLPGEALLRAEGDGFRAVTGGMDARFNARGELVSLRYRGAEMLDVAPGPSLALQLTLGPAGGNLERAPRPPQIAATIKEAGPVRAILNLRGKVWLADRRGEVELALDADYVFYSGRAEIHLRPMLLGAITEATTLSEWSLLWRLRSGRRMRYGREPLLTRDDPDHENMSWRGLEQGWVCWDLAGGAQFTAWSPDFQRHQNGFVHTRVQDEARERIRVAFARVEPQWGYQDVSNPPKPITINRGGWRRWEAAFALHDEATGPATDASSALAADWRSPLRAFPASEHYRQALRPWLEGVTQRTPLREVVASKCEEFVCKEPEYAGSLHGGWDGPNHAYIERGVSRADFGEYLFNEFFRSAEPRFHRMGFDFGQVYRDIYCFTIPEASAGSRELGGARSRQSEHNVDPIRSYRGAVLLADMYQETGDERYLEAMRLRAGFHLANYPHRVGRVSMSTRDSAYMARYLHLPALIDKAVEVTLHSLDKHFDPQHGYFEGYDESRTLPDGRFPAHPIPDGLWFMRDWLYTSNASPEMTSYNIIGWYGMRLLHDPGPEIMNKIRRVCEWMRDCQNADGSWPYPHDTSKTRWGHGSLQDAQAMVFAYRMFKDRSFLQAAERSIAFSERMFAEYGRIPLLLGILPHEETEDSLTYYYGIETLAHYAEIAGG